MTTTHSPRPGLGPHSSPAHAAHAAHAARRFASAPAPRVEDLSPRQARALTRDHGATFVVIVTQPLTYQHKDSFVMIASSPLRAIAARNAVDNTYRDMREKSPYLYPEFVAGPFYVFALAAEYADQLVVGRRGLPSKVRHACALAGKLGVPCYHIDKPPPGGFDAFLRAAEAPASYLDAAARLASATAVLQEYANAEADAQAAAAMAAEADLFFMDVVIDS